MTQNLPSFRFYIYRWASRQKRVGWPHCEFSLIPCAMPCYRLNIENMSLVPGGSSHAAARFHHPSWWHGSIVAAHRARATRRSGRIGMLMAHAENDPEFRAYVAA